MVVSRHWVLSHAGRLTYFGGGGVNKEKWFVLAHSSRYRHVGRVRQQEVEAVCGSHCVERE